MDPRIINDAFEQQPHICAMCECMEGNHLIFHKCPLFENNPICQDCCRIDMLKDDVDAKVSAKLGRPTTKEFINEMCRGCGLNSACQNQKLANDLEHGTGGKSDTQPKGPPKLR